MYVCMYGHHIKQEKDQPGKIANSVRGQLNRNKYNNMFGLLGHIDTGTVIW